VARSSAVSTPTIDRLSFGNPFGAYDSGEIPGWEFGGDAFLTEDYLALTPPSINKIGYVWTTDRVPRAGEWEVDLEFHIGGVPKRGAGGGLAFWLTANKGTNGSIYGHDENYHGLGLLFDTFESSDPTGNEPFVVAMVNQGGDLGADGKATYASKQVGVCFADYRNHHQPVHAKVTLKSGDLHVALDLEGEGKFKSCLSTDTGDERLRTVPEQVYIGVTASTGVHADSHVLYSLALRDLSVKPAAEPELPHEPSGAGPHEVHAVSGHTEALVPVGSGVEPGVDGERKVAGAPPARPKPNGHPAVPVPKPQHSASPTPAAGGGGGALLGPLAERLARVERDLERERQLAVKRHDELMGYLRAMRVSAGGGIGDSDSGFEPAALGGLAADIASIKAALEQLAGESEDKLSKMRAAIEEQLNELGKGLSSTDSGLSAASSVDAGDSARSAVASLHTLITDSVNKLHQLNENHQVTSWPTPPPSLSANTLTLRCEASISEPRPCMRGHRTARRSRTVGPPCASRHACSSRRHRCSPRSGAT